MSDRDDLARLLAPYPGVDHFELADAIIAAGWIPGDRPCPVHDWQEARAERDALAATVQRVRELCDLWGLRARSGRARLDSAECERELRAALAPSDPATDTGGEGL